MEFIADPRVTLVIAAAFAVSEALSLNPKVKSNGVFQLVYNILKKLAGKQ